MVFTSLVDGDFGESDPISRIEKQLVRKLSIAVIKQRTPWAPCDKDEHKGGPQLWPVRISAFSTHKDSSASIPLRQFSRVGQASTGSRAIHLTARVLTTRFLWEKSSACNPRSW